MSIIPAGGEPSRAWSANLALRPMPSAPAKHPTLPPELSHHCVTPTPPAASLQFAGKSSSSKPGTAPFGHGGEPTGDSDPTSSPSPWKATPVALAKAFQSLLNKSFPWLVDYPKPETALNPNAGGNPAKQYYTRYKGVLQPKPPVEPPFPIPKLPRGPLSARQLFGEHPEQVIFRQRGGNTCYLLASLDSILHHPRALDILDLIQVNRTWRGFTVKFPAQKPIRVKDGELGGKHYRGVLTDSLGVRLLERAYAKIPGSLVQNGGYDTEALALKRILGSGVIDYMNEPDCIADPPDLLQESKAPFRHAARQNYADIWTGVRNYHQSDNRMVLGNHYCSLRLNPRWPGQVIMADPFNTAEARVWPANLVEEHWQAELVRIPLPHRAEAKPHP